MSKRVGIIAGTAGFCLAMLFLSAQATTKIPMRMNYQGYLTDPGGTPINGTRNLRFRLYDAGGSALNWVETHNNVNIVNGIFNVVLGASTTVPVVINETFREAYYLEIIVDHTGAGAWETMTPRHLLSNAAYAMAARKVVYQQVLTVAHDGGDTNTASGAIDMLLGQGAFAGAGALSPAPSMSTQWVIEVKAGQYNEAGTFGGGGAMVVPDWVTLRGQGWNATELQVSAINLAGQGRALESLMISGKDTGVILINMAGAQYSYVRECKMEVSQPLATIDLSNANLCDVVENYLVIMGPGNCGGIVISGINDSRVEDNVINLNYFMPAGNGSFGLSDQGAPMIEGYILENTVQYTTTDVWPGCAYGIGLSNGGGGRVSSNVFYHGLVNKDIVDLATGLTPAPAFTPDGVYNQDSAGAAMAGF